MILQEPIDALYKAVCGSGGRAGWLVTARLLVCVEVSLIKTPYSDSRQAGCCLAWLTPLSMCECVHEWVNVRPYCKVL